MHRELRKNIPLNSFVLLIISIGIYYWFSNYNSRFAAQNKHTLLVQGICQSDLLTSVNDRLGKLVDKIVKKELETHNVIISDPALREDYHFFLPKERQRLTFYYINDSDSNCIGTISQALEKLIHKYQKNFLVQQVNITTDLRFFGEKEDELVSIINDPKKELFFLNTIVKDCMHDLYKRYKNLYDIQKSEKFSYLPHIGLGRIRASTIKTILLERKNSQDSEIIFKSIMEKIRKEAVVIVQNELLKQTAQVHFKSISVLDLNQKKYIIEIISPISEQTAF